jgi:hypothetical protein
VYEKRIDFFIDDINVDDGVFTKSLLGFLCAQKNQFYGGVFVASRYVSFLQGEY